MLWILEGSNGLIIFQRARGSRLGYPWPFTLTCTLPPPLTPLAQLWWRSGRSAGSGMRHAKPLPQPVRCKTKRALRGLQRRQQRTRLSKTTHLSLQRPQRATRLWGLRRLRRRPNLRKPRASSMHLPSSSSLCILSARCCRTQGHGTPCLRCSCSRSWWPRVSCGTTFKVTHQGRLGLLVGEGAQEPQLRREGR